MSASLLSLLDDIAAVLDDAALMTKVATKKTAGVLGDDLALNAEQVAGTHPDREIPVVWAVAKGSALNKAVLVPFALAISTWLPALITPLMLFGGAFLCFEGVEKLIEGYRRRRRAGEGPGREPVEATERDRIRGAIRTDFVLSAEIVVISLGAVADAPIEVKALTLVGVSVVATVGIYGLVAAIVKLDDLGLVLRQSSLRLARVVASGLLKAAPLILRGLSIVGTAAVVLVGGGIVTHSVERLKRWAVGVEARLFEFETLGQLLAWSWPPLFDAVVGILLGALSSVVVALVRRMFVLVRAPAGE
jgi:predicted DNA repair protein MutK